MNAGFAGSGFQFRLTETTRTVEPSLFNMFYAQGGEPRFFRGSHKEIRMKQALYSGDSETLNLYSSSSGKRLLGWAYLPWDFDPEIGNPAPPFLRRLHVRVHGWTGVAHAGHMGRVPCHRLTVDTAERRPPAPNVVGAGGSRVSWGWINATDPTTPLQSRVSLRCVTRWGRAASAPSRSTLLAS